MGGFVEDRNMPVTKAAEPEDLQRQPLPSIGDDPVSYFEPLEFPWDIEATATPRAQSAEPVRSSVCNIV